MSMESAKAFLERVGTDENFRIRVGGIATADQRMEFVRKSGYAFSKEEIDRAKDELDEGQLDEVVGGGTWVVLFWRSLWSRYFTGPQRPFMRLSSCDRIMKGTSQP
ncbi:MAG: Nif11-like leader peptide family natural product precursor [Deltaproteobacteria bacterium]|nr:Nif11-like leader peptide family natural product precursor [Deltaproteobacteria bacterium]